jgi:hypothetical protein
MLENVVYKNTCINLLQLEQANPAGGLLGVQGSVSAQR